MCRLAAFGNCESISPTRFCLFIACQVLPLFGVTSVGLELVMPAPPPPSRKVRTKLSAGSGAPVTPGLLACARPAGVGASAACSPHPAPEVPLSPVATPVACGVGGVGRF